MKAARQRDGEEINDTREVNPGEVWEENEFWMELTWRIDPDGSLGIRQYVESKKNPGTRLSVDEYYEWIFENSVPGLPEKAAAENLTPLEFMRRYGAFEINEEGRRDLRRDRAERRTRRRSRRSLWPRLHARAETCVAKHRAGSQS